MSERAEAWGWDRADLSPVPEPAAVGLVIFAAIDRIIHLLKR